MYEPARRIIGPKNRRRNDSTRRVTTASASRAASAFGFILGIAALLAPGVSKAQPTDAGPSPRPQVILPDRTDTSAPLRDMPILPDQAGRKHLPRKEIADRIDLPEPIAALDPALDDTSAPAAGTPVLNFEGTNNRNGVLPPDTNGDIGPNHYVQWVNLSLQIWSINRVAKTATSGYGPVNGNTIWSGFGGACQTTNSGDPIVLYDQQADRWMISQFALPNYPNGPFYQCIAVSQGPNPTGEWHRYQFTVSNSKMNDYPHFGVWPDGYYVSFNQFNAGSLGWAGQGVAVFERDKMLDGLAARMVYFDLYPVDKNLGGMLPSDLDGPNPPAQAPNVFAEIDDNAWGYSLDQIQLWKFHVDWVDPANSTFKTGPKLATAAFDSNMCKGARGCIPQRGTSRKLDALADRLMYRLQYRNFGDYETLVTNHTVDVDGTDLAGVRWYELRKSATETDWSIHQQGTYSPDSADHRWMASVAMNGSRQIALGYSISSQNRFPSIRYTGRQPDAPDGAMSEGENTIIDGTGYQSSTYSRWGDYSSMSVDPVDDCTFWFTTEYCAQSGTSPWQTRIAAFQLYPGCGAPVDVPPWVKLTNPVDGAKVSGIVTVTADAGDDRGVTQVKFFVDDKKIGEATDPPYEANWNTITAGPGTHTVTATATDTANPGQTGSDSNTVTVDDAPGIVMHVGDLYGTKILSKKYWKATVTVAVHDASENFVDGATVNFTWSGGLASCVTNTSGQCSATTGNIINSTTSVTFTVTNVSKDGATYNADANHDVDGGSNGTSITVLK